MAVTGKFIGDFSSFTDAVKKANVSLDSLEVNSGKVQSALQRMTTQFQGQKLIQDAQLATEAVKNIGGATALTESEQKKLNSQLTEAIAKYAALGKKAPDDMLALAKATTSAGSATSKWIGDFGTSVAGMATGMISAQAVIGGVQAAIGGLVSFVGSSISSFAAAEAAEKKMTVALTNMGLATPATVQQMNDLAGSFQKTTIYGDDLISEMQALLIQVGGVAPHAMDAALKASTDLAAGLGIDLEQATTIVAKAFAGNTEALGKYGIKVDEATLKSEGMSAVLDEINARFGGQAAAATETYAGKLAQLANEWDNLKEAVGKFIVEQPALIGLLRDVTALFGDAGEGAEDFGQKVSRSLAAFAPQLSQALYDMNEYYRKANEMAALFKDTASLVPPTPKGNLPAPAPGVGDQSGVVAEQLEQQKQLNKAQKDAEAAAKAHADTIRKLREDLYGATAIAQAKNYTTVVTDATALSAEAQAQVNKVVGEGIAAYTRLGQTAPPAMRLLYNATLAIPPVIAGIGTAAIGTTVALKDLQAMPWPVTDKIKLLQRGTDDAEKAMVKLGHQVGVTMNQGAADARKFFAQIEDGIAKAKAFGERFASTIIGAIQSGQGVGKAAGGMLGESIGQTLGESLSKAVGGKLGGMLGGMLGPLGALGGQLLGDLADKAFGKLFGKAGRSSVEEYAATFEGGFAGLQKKIEALGAAGEGLWVKLTQGVGRNDKAAAAAAIAEVEAALAKAGEAAEATADVTEVQAQATIETAAEAARALESLKPALQENEAQWRAWGDLVTGELQRVADAVRAMPMPPVLSASTAASTIAPTDLGARGGGGTAVLSIDGRVLAEAVVPRIPGVVKRYGLA